MGATSHESRNTGDTMFTLTDLSNIAVAYALGRHKQRQQDIAQLFYEMERSQCETLDQGESWADSAECNNMAAGE